MNMFYIFLKLDLLLWVWLNEIASLVQLTVRPVWLNDVT